MSDYVNYPVEDGGTYINEDDLRQEAGNIVIDYVRDCIASATAEEMVGAYATLTITAELIALVDTVVLEMTVRWNE